MIKEASEPACTSQDNEELAAKLLRFRDGLRADQRKALNMLIGGAIATVDVNNSGHPIDEKAKAFSTALTTFESSLPPAQRQGLTALLTAGALAWGQSADPMPEDDVKPIALIWVHVARTAAVLLAGAITVIREAAEDDEEIIVPDVTGNLPT